MKYSWHVKWRRYCPISSLLCWMFENVSWAPSAWAYDLHDFFCPEEQEMKEEWATNGKFELNKDDFIPLEEI